MQHNALELSRDSILMFFMYLLSIGETWDLKRPHYFRSYQYYSVALFQVYYHCYIVPAIIVDYHRLPLSCLPVIGPELIGNEYTILYRQIMFEHGGDGVDIICMQYPRLLTIVCNVVGLSEFYRVYYEAGVPQCDSTLPTALSLLTNPTTFSTRPSRRIQIQSVRLPSGNHWTEQLEYHSALVQFVPGESPDYFATGLAIFAAMCWAKFYSVKDSIRYKVEEFPLHWRQRCTILGHFYFMMISVLIEECLIGPMYNGLGHLFIGYVELFMLLRQRRITTALYNFFAHQAYFFTALYHGVDYAFLSHFAHNFMVFCFRSGNYTMGYVIWLYTLIEWMWIPYRCLVEWSLYPEEGVYPLMIVNKQHFVILLMLVFKVISLLFSYPTYHMVGHHGLRLRAKKEARNHQRFKKPDVGGKHKKVVPGPVVPIPTPTPINPTPHLEPVPVAGPVSCEEEKEVIEGYTFIGFNFLVKEGKRVVLVEEDGIHQYNYHICEVVKVDIPEFSFFGRLFPSVHVQVCAELMQVVKSTLRLLPNESRNYSVVVNYLLEYWKDVPTHIRDAHEIVYIHFLFTKSSPALVNNQSALVLSRANCGGVFQIPYSDAPSQTYIFNGRWIVQRARGFHFDTHKKTGAVTKVKFDTQRIREFNADTCKHAYAILAPARPFLVYGDSAVNGCGALSRLFKNAEPTIPNFHARQYQLLSDIPVDIIERLAGPVDAVHFVHAGTHSLVTRRVKYPTPRYDVELARMVYTGHTTYTWEDNTRGSVVQLVDRLATGSNPMQLWWMNLVNTMVEFFGAACLYLVVHLYSPMHTYMLRLPMLDFWVNLPHPKRLYYQSLLLSDKTRYKIEHNVGEFELRLKREMAKVGKQARFYGAGGHLALLGQSEVQLGLTVFKQRLRVGSIPTGTLYAYYVDASEKSVSDAMYREATSLPPGDACFYFKSDDGFLIYNDGFSIRLFETDISACDSSNGFPVMALVLYYSRLLGVEAGIFDYIVQLGRGAIFRNPDNEAEYVHLLSETYFEYSGSKLTVLLNCMAMLCIVHGVCLEWNDAVGLDGGSLPGDRVPSVDLNKVIADGAQRFGWKLTIDERNSYNKITFLKRAYTGKVSWLVYGPILRSLVVVEAKPTAQHFGLTNAQFVKLSDSQRLDQLVQMKAKSLCNEPDSVIVCAIRARAGLPENTSNGEVTLADLQQRYDVGIHDLLYLSDCLRNLQLGDYICCPALERIYHVDYGTELSLEVESRITIPTGLGSLL